MTFIEKKKAPVLYSFRRCPYAIRARTAIYFSKIIVELREVSLKNKPYEMLNLSKKGTVPVLFNHKIVIDESFEVMLWALNLSDTQGLLKPLKENKNLVHNYINEYDYDFKVNLDKYKYSNRYINCKGFKGKLHHRDLAARKLINLNSRLKKNSSLYIYDSFLSILDISIFPFVRQFRNVDADWFDNNPKLLFTGKWLNNLVESDFFTKVMYKYKIWNNNSEKIFFP